MRTSCFRYVYGPVRSRRLGRSLGIDLVPFKTCTYDCVYCQLGRTTNKTLERRQYIAVEDVLAELEWRLAEKDNPDYISLAGSGEPTLNSGIGDLIGKIKDLTDIPVAVLTNGSLLWMGEVQDELMLADLVLPSLDAGDENLFRYVNRPHREISFERMADGLAAFTRRFSGEVWLEVLLLAGVTGMPSEAMKIAALARRIEASRVQLNTASRPPRRISWFRFPSTKCAPSKVASRPLSTSSAKTKGRASASRPSLKPGMWTCLAFLGRRPCTSADVATGLGIHATEALKHLDALIKAGKVTTVLVGGRTLYRRPMDGSPEVRG